MSGGKFEVGTAVRTTDDAHITGQIVEDFGDLAGFEVVVDAQQTAKSRRWAVALDDGRMVFLNDDGIEPIDSTSTEH
ncbi:hypothetical protein [Mycolicibacterium mengxianglii]|uniref:hypothetical protein n=1 Tax=Mycolicibacterium mengxianglii TaxID=2736649 RepID=UPI0018EF0C79|nr:hypothetical protein [Mycolicibacterium mengxianglii]